MIIDIIKDLSKAQYRIKNAHRLVEKKTNYLSENTNIVTVRYLFQSSPPRHSFLGLNLWYKNHADDGVKLNISNALEICLNQNYFLFNNTNPTLNDGLIMGNHPSSHLVVEIRVNVFEKN